MDSSGAWLEWIIRRRDGQSFEYWPVSDFNSPAYSETRERLGIE
jgi:hypothetical protein